MRAEVSRQNTSVGVSVAAAVSADSETKRPVAKRSVGVGGSKTLAAAAFIDSDDSDTEAAGSGSSAFSAMFGSKQRKSKPQSAVPLIKQEFEAKIVPAAPAISVPRENLKPKNRMNDEFGKHNRLWSRGYDST